MQIFKTSQAPELFKATSQEDCPLRRFASDDLIHNGMRTFDVIKDDTMAKPVHVWLLHKLSKSSRPADPEFVFSLGRAKGGHTMGHLQAILADDNGRLQVSIAKTVPRGKGEFHFKAHEAFYGGLTLTCAQMVDNEVRSSGIVHNVDYLMNDDDGSFYLHRVGYEQYETFNATSSTLPFTDKQHNLKVDVSWNEWSCCSACCCSVTFCGLYANAKKCDEIDSYRTREGYLSVMLLDFKKPELLESWRAANERGNSFLGLFIQEENCARMEQKMNCSLLAACRGQVVFEPPPPVEELVPVDPCAETPMVTLSVIESSSSFRFEPNASYRLRLDGLDMESLKSIKWKIGERTIDSYDTSKPCHEQGVAVHENGFDLILIEPNETQVVGVVIEAFTGRHRFRIHFLTDNVEFTSSYDHRVTIKRVAIVAAIIVLLLAALTIIHNFKWRTHVSSKQEETKRKGDKPDRTLLESRKKKPKTESSTPAPQARPTERALAV
ncbi:hypothetical protein GCK32_003290 [Trichostrongylus colubriformis]|uniref:Uncharacterized protein n=1 Tax=Trichostrongylus colubriformis TaxID=6319 RepID=A0AAN8G3A5_TRICO